MKDLSTANGEPVDAGEARAARARAAGIRVALSGRQRSAVEAEAKRRGVPMTVLVRNMVEQFIPGSEGTEPPLSMPSAPPPANGRAAAAPSVQPPPALPAPSLPDAVAGVEADGRYHVDLPDGVGFDPPSPGSVEAAAVPPGDGAARTQPVPAAPSPGFTPGPGGQSLEGSRETSLVLQGGAVTTESGVMVMLPGLDEHGRPRTARLPIASYTSRSKPAMGFAAVFAAMPAPVRYFLVFFAVLSVCLGFAYLGSTVVASRYVFSEVEMAPGRSTFYRVDRWTGEMVRCSTTVGPSEPVC